METFEDLNRAAPSSEPIPLFCLGELLISARREQGLTQIDLAKRMGKHQSAISRWEASKYQTADIQTILTVVEALGLDLALVSTLKAGTTG